MKLKNRNLNEVLCSIVCIATRMLEDAITARRTEKKDKIFWVMDVNKDIIEMNDLIPDLDKYFDDYKKEIELLPICENKNTP